MICSCHCKKHLMFTSKQLILFTIKKKWMSQSSFLINSLNPSSTDDTSSQPESDDLLVGTTIGLDQKHETANTAAPKSSQPGSHQLGQFFSTGYPTGAPLNWWLPKIQKESMMTIWWLAPGKTSKHEQFQEFTSQLTNRPVVVGPCWYPTIAVGNCHRPLSVAIVGP